MNLRYINSNVIRKRTFVILVLIVLVFVIYNQNSYSENCFEKFHLTDGKTLADVAQNKILSQHKNSKNIFFHETSCNPGNKNYEFLYINLFNLSFSRNRILIAKTSLCH